MFRETATDERQDYPSYTQIDVRVGAAVDSLTFTAFVNNLTDKRGLLVGDVSNFVPFAYNYTQPRTFGLTLTKTF